MQELRGNSSAHLAASVSELTAGTCGTIWEAQMRVAEYNALMGKVATCSHSRTSVLGKAKLELMDSDDRCLLGCCAGCV